MSLPGVPSAVCTLCKDNEGDNYEQTLLTCSYIMFGAENLLLALQHEDMNITMERIRLLYFRS